MPSSQNRRHFDYSEMLRLRSLCVPDEMWARAELLFHLSCRMSGAAKVCDLGKFLLDSLKPFLSFAVLDLSFSSIPGSTPILLTQLLNASNLRTEMPNLLSKYS